MAHMKYRTIAQHVAAPIDFNETSVNILHEDLLLPFSQSGLPSLL